ncbi:MAG: hypothetical protein ACI8V7_000321 [Candidatus Paceibacteria bacterium]|jgi:hypothetical protein
MKIKPIGSFLEVDSEGYIINPTSANKLQDNWRPVIDNVIKLYEKNYGNNLSSVYIRGSVAKGTAIEKISDIDTFALIDLPENEVDNKWISSAEKQLKDEFPFITGAELAGISKNSIPKNVLILLNQSLLVHGKSHEFSRMKITDKLAIHAPNIEKRFRSIKKSLSETEDPEEIKDYCAWIMKGYLRIGMEILIEKSGKYSRDLYPCYKLFSQYYPERESDMEEILMLAIKPTADKDTIERIGDDFGNWLLIETKKFFP